MLDPGTGPLVIGGARLRALVARLGLEGGRAVRPEVLAEALWAGAPPADQVNALQSLVSRLRGLLGDPALLGLGPAGYRLAVEAAAVDVVRFEQLAGSGRQLLAQGRPAEAALALREALGLWRGPALADVREAPFAEAAAERLERARLAALEERIEADLALGAGPELVAELESLTADHPLHERLHAQLVRALAVGGRGAEALAGYQRIRERLADTFGSDPGPQLQAAHLAVLRGELPSQQDRPEPWRARLPGNLEAPLTSFVGREDDVRRVVGLLGQVRLVTLVGPGGAGKTRLATASGRELTPSGGVWCVALAPVAADDLPRAVLGALRAREAGVPKGASGPGGAGEEVLDRLAGVLAGEDLVLVLDNCEHLVEAVAALAETLLGRCPRLRVLATSREALRIEGEVLHPVLPLGLPDPDSTAEQARTSAAVRLFRDRALAVRPDFEPVGDALTAAIEICRRLDGLPLAIELAAARLRTLPVEVVAARLDDRFRLLTRGSRTALPRHRTLRGAVAWSWELMDADERVLLERLSVVPGSFTEDAAQAVGGLDVRCGDGRGADGRGADGYAADVRELVAALVDKSLLHPLGAAATGEPRYRMLETIREYGLEQLTRRGEAGAARARHAAFFLELAERAEPLLRTRDQLRWLARLSAERDSLPAAVRWAVDSGDAGTAVRLAAALCWFWSMRGYPPESLDLLGRVLELPGPVDPVARALVVATHEVGTESIGRPQEREAAFGRIEEAMAGIDPGVHPLLELARLAAAIGGPKPPAGSPGAPGSPGGSGALGAPGSPGASAPPVGERRDPRAGRSACWSRAC